MCKPWNKFLTSGQKKKRKNTLVSGNAGDEKIFTQTTAKNFFCQVNWSF